MQRQRDRWRSIALSVLLHAALLAALVYGWMLYRRPPPPAPTLAIEAKVVDARSVPGALQPQPAPPAQSEPQESEGPPQPTPEELTQREQQRQQAQAAEEQRRAAEQRAAEQKAAEEQAAREAEEQRQAAARAAAERKAREAEAQKHAEEERQRVAEAQDLSDREADLKRSLAAEAQSHAARAGPAREAWLAQIAAKITHAWIRPPTARPGIECVLDVTQVPGGEVTQVSVGQCSGDQAVRESIENAVYHASPLPPPPDPADFDRHLRITFKPD